MKHQNAQLNILFFVVYSILVLCFPFVIWTKLMHSFKVSSLTLIWIPIIFSIIFVPILYSMQNFLKTYSASTLYSVGAALSGVAMIMFGDATSFLGAQFSWLLAWICILPAIIGFHHLLKIESLKISTLIFLASVLLFILVFVFLDYNMDWRPLFIALGSMGVLSALFHSNQVTIKVS